MDGRINFSGHVEYAFFSNQKKVSKHLAFAPYIWYIECVSNVHKTVTHSTGRRTHNVEKRE